MIVEETERILDLNRQKGGEYAGEDDALAFLKEAATESGQRPAQIWWTLARKHWRSIAAFVRSGGARQSEPIDGRIRDLILYLFLLLALSREEGSEDREVRPKFKGGDEVIYDEEGGPDWRAKVTAQYGDILGGFTYGLDFEGENPPPPPLGTGYVEDRIRPYEGA